MKSAATDADSKGGVLIIGYGNSLRGDDAVGILAARSVEAKLASGCHWPDAESRYIGTAQPTSAAPVRHGSPPKTPAARGTQFNITVLTCHQLTPELVEPISHACLIIFLDASAEIPAGQVACQPVIPAEQSANALGHHLSPAALLAWADALYAARPEGILITAGIASTAVGDELSLPLVAALPRMVRLTLDALDLRQTRKANLPAR